MNQFTLAAVNFAWLPILPLIAVTVGAMVIMLDCMDPVKRGT